MKYRSKTIIEITEKTIKIFQSTGNSLTFATIVNIENISDEGIAQKLSDLQKKKNLNLKASQVILVIPRQYAIIRYLDLPSENPQELKTMVDLQAVNHLPYNRDEVVVDFMPLEKNGEGYTKVLILAVAKETIMRFEKLSTGLNVIPQQISLSFIGIWQWYCRNHAADQGITAIIDIDTDKTEICFCDQQRVLISRPTSLGLKEINAKEYDKFLEQLDWTIATYVKEQLGHPVVQILVLSSVDNLEDFKTFLQVKYKATVNTAHTLKNSLVKKSFPWPKGLTQEGLSVTAALGFLQSQNESSIDLTPLEIRDFQSSETNKRNWVRFSVIAVLAIISLGFCLSIGFLKKNTQLSALEKKIKSTQKEVSLIQKKQKQVNTLKNIIENRVVLIEVFSEVYRLLPENVTLTNLTLSQEHALSMQGFSVKAGDINDMQKAFVDSAYFDNVNLDFVNKRVTLDGEINYFKITCHVKTKGQPNEEAK